MFRKLLGLKPKLTGSNDQRPYDECWDIALNAAMDNFSIEPSEHTAKIGPFRVWIANYPYAYGRRSQPGHPESGLPSLQTRARLYQMVRDAACAGYMDEVEGYKPDAV